MRRIQFYSPKAARMLVLFSYDAVATWALAVSSALVVSDRSHHLDEGQILRVSRAAASNEAAALQCGY